MPLGNLILGQKDYLIAIGISKALEKVEELQLNDKERTQVNEDESELQIVEESGIATIYQPEDSTTDPKEDLENSLVPIEVYNNILKGGENHMTNNADKLKTLDLARDDHYEAAKNITEAVDQYEDEAERATAVAEELGTAYELSDAANQAVVNGATEYLLNHREQMDDLALELLEGAEEIEERLEGTPNPDTDEVMEAVHVAARFEYETETEYDFDF